tara:strand:- start:507 stop:1610 length:1104 start_codon:yes stop_codon:yes gene_type:complete
VALESIPERGDPLVDHLRLISKSNSPRLLETRLELLAEARLELLDEPAAALAASLAKSPRATSCGRLRAALLPHTATIFELAVDRFAELDTAREGLSLRLARWGEDLEIALVARRADPGQGGFLEVVEEVALLERLAPGRGLLLVIPAPFDPGYAGYALALDCAPAGSVADEQLARQARGRRSEISLAPIVSASPAERAPAPQTLAAVAAPDAPPSLWSRLAHEVGASLSERLLLLSQGTQFEALRPAWRSALASPPLGVGWHMERATARALLTSDAPWSRALLLERCGALGADPAALGDTLDLAQSLAGWEALLRRENRYLLRSSFAGVRARAFTWLQARGLSPVGYDPFGPREARREALHKGGGS